MIIYDYLLQHNFEIAFVRNLRNAFVYEENIKLFCQGYELQNWNTDKLIIKKYCTKSKHICRLTN